MHLRSSRVYTAPIPKMPPGLVELMEGLTKDVLKNNPADVYDFCANHMQKLLELRDGCSPRTSLTLEQKITKARNKVRQRSEFRRQTYDKEMQQYLNDNNQPIPKPVNENLRVSSEAEESDGEKKTIHEQMEHTNDSIPKNLHLCVGDEVNEIECIHSTIMPINTNALPPNNDSSIVNITNDSNGQTIAKDEEANIAEKSNSHKLEQVIEDCEDNRNKIETILGDVGDVKFEQNIASIVVDEVKGKENIDNFINENVLLDDDNHLEKHGSSSIDVDKNNIEVHVSSEPKSTIAGDVEEKSEIQNSIVYLNVPDGLENQHELATNVEGDSVKVEYGDHTLSDISAEINTDKEFMLIEDNADDTETNSDDTIKTETDATQRNDNDPKMDLETAAVTIQKVFRNFLFKAKSSSFDDATHVELTILEDDKECKGEQDNIIPSINKERRTLGINRMDTVLQTVNEEKSLSLSTDDSSTLSSAATIIQAHVRGFLVRNKLNFNKTISTNSLIDSDGVSLPSLEAENEQRKNKTVLNIHIVPEGSHFISRDETILNSMDLSLDSSPPSSTNLHPLGYDKSERRKQLKREDAIQSVSPPSNNSGKLSEDVDSVKEVLINDDSGLEQEVEMTVANEQQQEIDNYNSPTADTMVEITDSPQILKDEKNAAILATDETDVVTPFVSSEETETHDSDSSQLLHSGEFHDIVLPTKVSRSDTSVVREFQNVLVYFLLWNNS